MTLNRWNRRHFLQLGSSLLLPSGVNTLLRDPTRLFPVGACDWSLGKRQQLSALQVAKEIGLDGVQVSFGEPGLPYDLRKPAVREEYRMTSEKLGVQIASLAMGELNNRPYAADAEAEQWVADCIGVMTQMKQKIVLVAFFGKGDIKDKPAEQKEVIRRLKKVAPQAERAGVTLAIESWLHAEEHLRILEAVGSPAVKVYYDVCNMAVKGYDIFPDMRRLGRDRICEIHLKENGFLLGQGVIDFKKVKATLDDMGWNGWLILEGATIKTKSLVECYRENLHFVRTLWKNS